MDSVSVRTPRDFEDSEYPNKKRRHSAIACETCRKLKVRCQGGTPKSQSCSHCDSLGRQCEWPEEDGRKLRRQRQLSVSLATVTEDRSDGTTADRPLRSTHPPSNRENADRINGKVEDGNLDTSLVSNRPTETENEETPFTAVHYFRHFGPTAIAPGHKRITLKARQDDRRTSEDASMSIQDGGRLGRQDGLPDCLPLFEEHTGLPVPALLPVLIDKYFEYYGDIFCFSNRKYLESLVDQHRPPIFLLSVMSTLASRFCDQELFLPYFPPLNRNREHWEYSIPFLVKSKSMTMSAISLPSPDVVAGLLLMAFADFGDNNEAGLWMLTGMAVRMIQELGLHRERSCLDMDATSTITIPNEPATTRYSNSVTLEQYHESSELVLFWTVFCMDAALCNGTGRVPSLKRHEINARLPQNSDLAVIRAGPGQFAEPEKVEIVPHLAKMMLLCAQSIDFLNTGSSQIRFQSEKDDLLRMERLEGLKTRLLGEYNSLPKEVSFGATFYQAASKAGQAGVYLLLHLQYYCQIAFLTQEILSDKEHNSHGSHVGISGKADLSSTNTELYRTAIKCVTKTITFTKLVDERPLLSLVYLNQPIFHAACAYTRDMLECNKKDPMDPRRLSSSAFPIPSDTSPSVVLPEMKIATSTHSTTKRKRSHYAAESTYNFLSLIAKTNYQFLRQTIKDQAKFYAGSGWLDATLDQRETGLRDVDLSIVSDSISTFIRLHDLSDPGAAAALQRVAPNRANDILLSQDGAIAHPTVWNGLSAEMLADADFNFDPQAFFDDYLYTEMAQQNEFAIDETGEVIPGP